MNGFTIEINGCRIEIFPFYEYMKTKKDRMIVTHAESCLVAMFF